MQMARNRLWLHSPNPVKGGLDVPCQKHMATSPQSNSATSPQSKVRIIRLLTLELHVPGAAVLNRILRRPTAARCPRRVGVGTEGRTVCSGRPRKTRPLAFLDQRGEKDRLDPQKTELYKDHSLSMTAPESSNVDKPCIWNVTPLHMNH